MFRTFFFSNYWLQFQSMNQLQHTDPVLPPSQSSAADIRQLPDFFDDRFVLPATPDVISQNWNLNFNENIFEIRKRWYKVKKAHKEL